MSEQIQTTILRNATKMALEHVKPGCCADCVGARCAIHNLSELAVRNNHSVRESVNIFNEQMGACEGMKPTGEVRDCMPQMRCGHALGAAAVGRMWGNALTSTSDSSESKVN